MNADQITAFLACLGESAYDGGEWVNTHCPLAPWRHQKGYDRTPSFGIKVGPGDSHVYCFGCQFSGSQTELLLVLKGLVRGTEHGMDLRKAMRLVLDAEEGIENLELDWTDETEKPRSDYVFPESWLRSFLLAYDEEGVHPYLEERGVPWEVAENLKLRFMAKDERICFPVRNWKGQLVGLHGRTTLEGVEPKYKMITHRGHKNPMAWLGEHYVDPEIPVVLAESVFDLARVYQVYRNVMCPLTASMGQSKLERIARLDHVVTFFDPDQAGDVARRKVRRWLEGSSVVEHCVNNEDLRDPADLDVDEVADLLEEFVDLDQVIR